MLIYVFKNPRSQTHILDPDYRRKCQSASLVRIRKKKQNKVII
jgi:hypothetical protein